MTTTSFDILTDAIAASPAVLPSLVLLLKVTGLLLAALALSRLLQRASAGSRHLVWLVAIGALLVLPPLAAWGPLPIRVLPATLTPAAPATPAVRETAREGRYAGRGAEAIPQATVLADDPPGSQGEPAVAPAPDLGEMLLGLWAIVALALLGRLAFGAAQVRRIIRRSRPLEDPTWQAPLYEIADRLGLEAAPRLVQSDDVKMPFAAGVLSAVIVLPAESEGWSADRRSAVLIHELGHVRRRDLIGHTLGRIACAIYWFHPLVWRAARQLRAESERACDDLALVFGARPSDYAEHLLEIVTSVRDHRTPAVALAMAHRGEFEGRMLAILNPELRRRGPGRVETASFAGALAGLALLVGVAAPVARNVDPRPTGAETEVNILPTDLPLPPQQVAVPRPAADPEPVAKPAASVLAALPDSGDERVVVLARTLRTDAEPSIRRVAAWGLHRHARNELAVEALIAAATGDADAKVREMATWALGGARRGAGVGAALAKVARQDRDPAARATALWALGSNRACEGMDAAVGLLGDADAAVRDVAAWAVGSCGPDRAPAGLVRLLADSVKDVRLSAAWALYMIHDPETTAALDAAFRRERDPEVQRGLIHALGAMGEQSVEALQQLVSSPDPEIRSLAVTALAGGHSLGPWPWPRPEPRPFP